MLAMSVLAAAAQKPAVDADKNAAQARVVLDQMVKALGGDAWLNLKCEHREGRAAAFYQGKPTGGTVEYFDYHVWGTGDRMEYTKHRDVVDIFKQNKNQFEAWEITYRGLKPLPAEQTDEYQRRRRHSIETVVKVWLKDPQTILIFEGQHLAARHNADVVTVISPQNESETIYVDTQTHLPLKKTYQWRDAEYKDLDTESEEFDDYHTVDGIPTAFAVTRFKNDDMVSQRFLFRAKYNEELPADFFDEKVAEQRIKKSDTTKKFK